ncbi:MAG: DUF3817 domain-containing protein [Flavobacteriaceae bacterium]
MLLLFRITAILEGLSYLALFAFSMPLKYWAGLPQYNIYVGYAHGFLFLAYITLAVVFFLEKNQKWDQLVRLILASLLPFGTFYIEERYLRTTE